MTRNQKRWLMLVSAVSFHVIGYLLMNAWLAERGVTHDVAISLDDRIPFIKYFAPVYAMVYLIPILTFFICWKNYEMIVAGWRAFIGAGVISLLAFYFYPVEFQLRAVLHPPYDFFENIVRFLYWVDSPPYNCFPSLHVALAFISARVIHLYRAAWGKYFYTLAAVITVSTLLVRQHYILDLVAGMGVTLLMDFCFLRRQPRAMVSQPETNFS